MSVGRPLFLRALTLLTTHTCSKLSNKHYFESNSRFYAHFFPKTVSDDFSFGPTCSIILTQYDIILEING